MKNDILIGQRIHAARLARHMTQTELGDRLAVHKGTVSRWENGKIDNISLATIERLADVLSVNVAWLSGKDVPMVAEPKKHKNLVPVVGDIKGGYPIEIVEDILDYEEIDDATASKGEYIALRVKGDSMAPKISEGDVAIIHWQPTVENGQIAAVRVNEETSTLKKFYQDGSRVTLVSLNPSYPPMMYDLKDKNTKIEILGRLVELRAKF